MIVLTDIQQKLAEALRQSGQKQNAIARALGVTPQTVSCYIHGKKTPSLDTFANLCRLLDVDSNEILCIKK